MTRSCQAASCSREVEVVFVEGALPFGSFFHGRKKSWDRLSSLPVEATFQSARQIDLETCQSRSSADQRPA
jgi:hypothetical protein